MHNDLSRCKAGDYIWTISHGWEKIIRVDKRLGNYPIQSESGGYTLDGKRHSSDVAPSSFTRPPKCFKAGKPPCKFKKGDKVLVSDVNLIKFKRYFSHEENGMYYCFDGGRDEWSSEGCTTAWEYCELFE